MTKLDSVYRTQNLVVAELVLQHLEERNIVVPEAVEREVIDKVREFGDREQGGHFKERIRDAVRAELEKRFPNPEPFSSRPPELHYFAMLDAALAAAPVVPPQPDSGATPAGSGSAASRPEPLRVSALRAPIPGAEREAFEAWMNLPVAAGQDPAPWIDGLAEDAAWQAWQARAARAQTLTDELRGLDTPTRVRFYEHDFYPLSNFSAFALQWGGTRFDTSEAAYHWEKFPGRTDLQERILYAPSAHEAFKIAESHKRERRSDWDDVKVDIMRDILRAKAEQHEYVRRKLLATGDRELVEDSWRDDFWGWGPNRDGKNMLGRLWMELRAELRVRRHV